MPIFKRPLSGDVVQNISPFTAFMSPIGSQFGLVNIALGQSCAPPGRGRGAVGYRLLRKAAQLGQIGDALLVLIERMPKGLNLDEDSAVKALENAQ
jgi:hypothetical protein